MDKTIVILGKGFVGTALANHFEIKGIETLSLSKENFDYSNSDVLFEFLSNNKSDIKCIINCSGYTGYPNVDACESNKELCYKLNVIDPIKVVELCNTVDLPVIHVGSGCIYSGYDKVYTEKDYPDFGLENPNSSYYSKCKHSFEHLTENMSRYVFRIRIPFTNDKSSKNYFTKLLKYDNLINENNSVTSITDFGYFVEKFVNKIDELPTGLYNVTNTEPVKAQQVVEILGKNGLENPNWNFIKVEDLNTVAKRSNCVLSTDKIKSFGLELPNTIESLERDIKILAGK